MTAGRLMRPALMILMLVLPLPLRLLSQRQALRRTASRRRCPPAWLQAREPAPAYCCCGLLTVLAERQVWPPGPWQRRACW